MFTHTHTHNMGAPECIREMLTTIKEEIDCMSVIVGNFKNPLTPMDRSSSQKINKETQDFNDRLDKIDNYQLFFSLTLRL